MGVEFDDSSGVSAREVQRNDADDAEAAIDELPEEGNPADRAQDKSPGDDQHAGDHACVDHPEVPHGIAQRSEEEHRDGDMPEGQPVGAIEEKRLLPPDLRSEERRVG